MELLPFHITSDRFFRGELPGIDLEPDTAVSFPVPAQRGEKLLDAVFLFHNPSEDRPLQGERPYAWALLSSETGQLELFSYCSVMDFISTDRYPLEERVSMELPKRLSAKKYMAHSRDLLEQYEKLRPFAFSENLNREEVATIVAYKERFLSLVYAGHYPFYHALSPEFFHWLRLPLPQIKMGRIPRDMENTREYQYQLLILENLQRLVQQFAEKIGADEQKDKLLDQLHGELQLYKNGLLDALTRSIELDVIYLIDSVRKTLEAYQSKEPTEEHYTRLLAQMDGVETDLRDLLYRHGVEPYSLYDEVVQVPRQKVVTVVPTDDPAKDKRIAKRLAMGWEKDGKTVRPERVSVYVYSGGDVGQKEQDGPAGPRPAQSEVVD